ncbi:MAG: hypothetical protein ABI863_22575 [Ginsengibacter sp.]
MHWLHRYSPASLTGRSGWYLSVQGHRQGDPSLNDIAWKSRPWSGFNVYADSKSYDVFLHLRLPGNVHVVFPMPWNRVG